MIEYTYNIFGLIIRSQLEIPELISIKSKQAHVTVQFGTTPEHLNGNISSGILYEATEKEFLLSLPNIGNYLVRNGDEVIIDPKSGASEDEIRLFLLGSVFGALLYQRGYLPLHGSAVEIAGKAIIILGNSAAGKSTLAASLYLSGYPLISDDLSAISVSESGRCVILPGISFFKLWKDSKNLLFPGKSFKQVRPQIMKYKIPVSQQSSVSKEYEIQTIVNLTTKNSSGYRVTPISGAKKLAVLREHVYRDQLIEGMGMPEFHFKMLSSIASQVQMVHVERPSVPLQIDDLKEFFFKVIQEY